MFGGDSSDDRVIKNPTATQWRPSLGNNVIVAIKSQSLLVGTSKDEPPTG